MKYKILLLLSFITQIAFAQPDNDKIENAIKMALYMRDTSIENIGKEYGADYRVKVKSIIDEFTPHILDKDLNICGGTNIAVMELLYSLCLKTYEADKSTSNTKILDDLNSLKKAVETALLACGRIYDPYSSSNSKLRFFNNSKGYEFDYSIVINTCLLLRYYYGSQSPVYLQTIGKILEYCVSRSFKQSKFVTNYREEDFDFLEKYDLIVDIYNQVDAQKFNNKVKEDLKGHITIKLPQFYSKYIQNKKFENLNHFLRYYEGLLIGE